MFKTLDRPSKVFVTVFLMLMAALAFTMTATMVEGQEVGLIVGAQHDGYKLGATVGMVNAISPTISLFVEGVIRDPQYEANARFGISLPLHNKWTLTMLLGPEIQSVPTDRRPDQLTTYLLASTGIALSHPISARSSGWIAMDWTPTDRDIQKTRFGFGIIAWL